LRSSALSWYGGLLAGLLPILLLGFLYSALADRIVFVGWALVFATLWVLVLRHGMGVGWPAPRLAGALALLLAAALAAFAALEKKHGEILDLGFRAVLPGLYHPNATAPRTAWGLAAAFAVLGAVAFGLGLFRKKTRKREAS
jgi:predicted outer membrane lipoprotein